MATMIAPVKMRAEPRADPRYARVKAKVDAQAAQLKKHPPAAKKASEPAKAAKAPPNEKAAGARANQVDKIEQAETPPPKPASFLETLQAEIAKAMPQTLGDTEKFMKGGEGNQVKDSLKGSVSQQNKAATGELKEASNTSPSESGVPAKPVTPIPPESVPPTPPVDGAAAMPAPKSDAQVSLQGGKDQVAEDLEKNKLTPKRLTAANDSRFSAVLTAQDKVAKQADAGPGKYRAAEAATLGTAAAQALATARKGASALLASKKGGQAKVASKQDEQKAREEKELQVFTAFVVTTFDQTKKSVDKRLADLETSVNDMFDQGTDAALADMKSFIEDQVFDYKLKRYLLTPGGSLLWIKDQILELPKEVDEFFKKGRERFTDAMNALAVKVTAVVERELAAAKAEVKTAQGQIAAAQKGLAPAVQARAAEVTTQYADKFGELEQGIEDKKQSLAEGLAQKYKDAFDKAAEVEKAIKDDNKGLVAQAKEKIEAVAKALEEFKNRLMGILRKGQETIELILNDPMQFLSNLLAAIKAGFNQFVGNIWTHLKAGFMKWLFGALAEAGIEVPSDLNIVSIVKMVLAVLGITYASMRAKAVKLIGETAVSVIEKVVEYVTVLIQGGPAALWEKIKEDLSNLKEMVIGAIQDWIVSTIVKKAVAKIVTMFNPAGAIIQAIMMIVSVVQFVIERASQIMDFVEAVINSIHAIATGAIGGAANWIEKSLANMIPILIGFLAALVGLGGLAAKIKGFILKVQAKVDKAIDKVLKKIVDVVKKLFGKLKAAAKKILNWWKKKAAISGGDEHHTLKFDGGKSDAKLMVHSGAPEAPSTFLQTQATKRGVKPAESGPAVSTAKTQEGAIKKTQDELKKFDENDAKAASGKAADNADKLVATLDGQLQTLAGHIGSMLDKWGVQDGEVKKISVPRGSFSVDQKRDIAKKHKEDIAALGKSKDLLRKDASGERINLVKGQARRHVVSSADMSAHYVKVLTGKKWSEAKLLLEQRGSIGDSHTPVTGKLSEKAVVTAANTRYGNFFGYAKNLFIGNSRENSAIQQHLDAGNPMMAGKLLYDHVRRIKREWAIDGSFVETPPVSS